MEKFTKKLISLWDEYCMSFNVINAGFLKDGGMIAPEFDGFIEWLRSKYMKTKSPTKQEIYTKCIKDVTDYKPLGKAEK